MGDLIVSEIDADMINIAVSVAGETYKISRLQLRHAPYFSPGICLVAGHARESDPV